MTISKTVQEYIDILGRNKYYIPSILEDEDTYEEMRTYFYDMLKGGFEIKELRECPVRFSFKLGEEHTMQLRRFYINLLMWYPLVLFNKANDIDESFIVTDYTAKGREKYFNSKIILPYRDEIDLPLMNIAINECIYKLSSIGRDFNVIMGDSMNMSDFVLLAMRNKKFNDLLNTEIDPNEQPGVVERMLDDKLKELLQILKTEENPLKATLLSGNNIKSKQLIEYFIAVGYKSTVDGKTIPVPISSNFSKGMKSIEEFYVEANSAIKAILANFTAMGDSGAWQKNIMNLCAGIRLDPEVEDCDSIKAVPVLIKSQTYLDMLDGRYRIGFRGKRIKISKDQKHLIGKTILIKSPITCGCKPGFICKKCYGELSKINGKMGVGALGAVKTTEPIGQSVLSTKHLNVTDSTITEFEDGVNEYCELNMNEIFLKKDLEIPLKDLRIIIPLKNVSKINSDDEGLEINEYVYEFSIKNIKTNEEMMVKEKHGQQLFISPELNNYIDENCDTIIENEAYVINPEEVLENLYAEPEDKKKTDDEDEEEITDDHTTLDGTLRLFIVEIQNNELTKPFNDLMDIYSYFVPREKNTIEWVYQRIFDLMIKAHLHHPAVFFEIMLKPLVRKASNILEYPDFTTIEGAKDYQITVIKTALTKHPSVLVGLAAPELNKQFKRTITYEKSAPGFLDEFFRK